MFVSISEDVLWSGLKIIGSDDVAQMCGENTYMYGVLCININDTVCAYMVLCNLF